MENPSRPDPSAPPSPSPTKFGPYWLDVRIAVGGTAEVYLARPLDGPGPASRLVVKRLLPHMLADAEGRTMFEREAKLHAAVTHDNVVTVYGSGVTDAGEPYLAMEYVDGVDCFRLLRRLGQEGRLLPAGLSVYIAREVLRGLASVHSASDASGHPLGIIHRDVTPSNVYLSKDGRVKLGDFGIARSTNRGGIRAPDGTMLKGKFAYFAPEQVAGEPFDHRADLFSLAGVLVEMLIGRPLFSGSGQLSVLLAIRDCRLDPVIEAKGRLPAGMFEVLTTALSREPQKRFQSASAFATALLPFAPPDEPAKKELGALVAWAQATSSTASLQVVRDTAKAFRPFGALAASAGAATAPTPASVGAASGSAASGSAGPTNTAAAAAKAPEPAALELDDLDITVEPSTDARTVPPVPSSQSGLRAAPPSARTTTEPRLRPPPLPARASDPSLRMAARGPTAPAPREGTSDPHLRATTPPAGARPTAPRPPPSAPSSPPLLPRSSEGGTPTLRHPPMADAPLGDFEAHEKRTGEYGRLSSFVRTARGERLGPWSFARLVEALATGSVGRGDFVDYMGQGFRPVEDVADLVRFLPVKTANTGELSGIGAPLFDEPLGEGGMVRILARLHNGRETGVLFVEREADGSTEAGRKELYFEDGRLHHVASSNAQELLGQYLVRRGMLARDELDFALAVLPRYGGRIGDTLISLGLVSAVDMFRAIKEQGRDRVADLFRWRQAKATFYRGQKAPHVEFPLDQDLPTLMYAGLEASEPEDAAALRLRPQVDRGVNVAPADEGRPVNAPWPSVLARTQAAVTRSVRLRDVLVGLTKDGQTSASDVARALEILVALKAVRLT